MRSIQAHDRAGPKVRARESCGQITNRTILERHCQPENDPRSPAMNIHEYQGKELLKRYGVTVLEGHVAWTPEEAEAAAAKLPGPVYVVKSQIHAGGRGAGRLAHHPNGKGGVRHRET